MLFDTDILIWAARGNKRAADILEGDPDRAVSVVTSMELLFGAKDKREQAQLRKALTSFETLPLLPEIGQRACLLVEQHALATSLSPLDALIAATAIEHQRPLCTANVKHYRSIAGLELHAFRV